MPTSSGAGGARALNSKYPNPRDALPRQQGGPLLALERTLPHCLGDRLSSPTSRKTGLPCSARPGPAGVLYCHTLILTLGKSAVLPAPASALTTSPGLSAAASVPTRNWRLWPYLLTFCISPRAGPQPTSGRTKRQEGAATRVHSGPMAGFLAAADNNTRACRGRP